MVGMSNMVNRFVFATRRHHEFSSSTLSAVSRDLAGWVNRQQQEAIDYLRTENQVRKEKLGGKRILLDDNQRWRLTVKGKILGRQRLHEVGTLVSGTKPASTLA